MQPSVLRRSAEPSAIFFQSRRASGQSPGFPAPAHPFGAAPAAFSAAPHRDRGGRTGRALQHKPGDDEIAAQLGQSDQQQEGEGHGVLPQGQGAHQPQARGAPQHQQGVQNILVTLWGDDGDETPLATVLPGLALYGLLRFGSAVPRQTDPFCRLFSDLPLAAYELMEKMDLIPGMPQENLEALIPHKLLLYGDMASELFQPVLTSAPDGLAAYYEDLSAQYAAHAQHTRSEGMQRILRLYQCLAQVLSARCTAAAALQTAGAMQSGRGGKKRALTAAAALLSEMETRVEQLHQQTVEVWSQERKGQGMEILDLRLGGIAARCKALRKRIELYNTGRIESLSELEEPFLPYQGILSQDGHTPGREAYGEIVTANTLCHQFSI